jgi:hypothetical protein
MSFCKVTPFRRYCTYRIYNVPLLTPPHTHSNPNIKISTFSLLSTNSNNLLLPIWQPTRIMHSACRHCNSATILVHNLHIFLQNLPRNLPTYYRPPSNAHLNIVHRSQSAQYLANHISIAYGIPMPFCSTMFSTPSYCIVLCQSTVHCCCCATRRLFPIFL